MTDNPTLPVFFYGLFMDEALLRSKNVAPTGTATGYVDGFRLRIGARATLVPEEGARAYGVVMQVAAEDAARLYSEESVADYVAEPVTVRLSGNAHVSAVSYNLPPGRLAGANPAYAAALLELAERLGFPAKYLDDIRRAAKSGSATGDRGQ